VVRQERAVRTREALIRSAAEVFDRKGFADASLSAISAGAGVSNGALHFHFASKGHLAEAVEEAAAQRLADLVVAGSERTTSELQLLVGVSHRLARAYRKDVVLRTGFELGNRPVRETWRETEPTLHRHWQDWVTETVRRAHAAGELHESVREQHVVTTVVAVTVGFQVLGAQSAAWLTPGALTQFWELLLPRLASAGL
jgi:AcrR family transcriptional regulator